MGTGNPEAVFHSCLGIFCVGLANAQVVVDCLAGEPRRAWIDLLGSGLVIVTFLAAGFNAFLADTPELAPFPLALSAIFAWIAYERRASITALGALIQR
ncbi:hypothetical protein ACFVMC_07860 [Nocardia sp. NPDC127579]|uniref:hypothetical protein n=1 Tax=Nocardia sp. NPDC127579 TaxID=3345402 RepID=UPI00364153E3